MFELHCYVAVAVLATCKEYAYFPNPALALPTDTIRLDLADQLELWKSSTDQRLSSCSSTCRLLTLTG